MDRTLTFRFACMLVLASALFDKPSLTSRPSSLKVRSARFWPNTATHATARRQRRWRRVYDWTIVA